MEATQNICTVPNHSSFGEKICGKDGFTSEILGNISFFIKNIILGRTIS